MVDVVTVCAGRDLENISICIESLKKNLEVNNIFVVTNDTSLVPEVENVIAIDETELISHETAKKLREIDFPHSDYRFGWYFQQFLKMEFSRSHYCQGDYLIWDADTILLKNITFLNNNIVDFTRGEEKLNNYYVSTYENLLGIRRYFNFSLISQHLFVDRNVMTRMIDEIESKHDGVFFCEVILNSLHGDSPSLFSEYETYVNYFAQKKSNYRIIKRKWFRHAAAICGFGSSLHRIEKTFPDCDYVALEKFDLKLKGRIKGWVRYFFYRLGL